MLDGFIRRVIVPLGDCGPHTVDRVSCTGVAAEARHLPENRDQLFRNEAQDLLIICRVLREWCYTNVHADPPAEIQARCRSVGSAGGSTSRLKPSPLSDVRTIAPSHNSGCQG